MDKYRHMEFYDLVKNMSFSEFLIYNFKDSPDFIFRLLLYIGGSIGIRVHYIFFVITFITIFLFLKVFKKYIESNNIERKYIVLATLLSLFSISYISVFSGMRNTLALSFIFYGYYLGLIERKKYALFYLLLGVCTHFSVVLFLFIYLIYPYVKRISITKLRILLFCSLLFIILPKDFLLDFFRSLGLGGALDIKANAYLIQKESSTIKSFSEKIIEFFDSIWIYLLSIYLIIKSQKRSEFYIVLLLLLISINIFISMPIIFNRYALFVKLILVLFLIQNEIKFDKIKFSFFYLILFLVNCLFQIIVMRPGLIEIFDPSFLNWSFIYSIIENNFTVNDIR
ncbi:EpsG family protein [Empedobacter falsenii]